MANATTKAAINPKPTPAKKTVAKKTPASKTAYTDSRHEAQNKMIQDAAYFIAEHNNFAGDPHTFWLQAEAQVRDII